MAKNDPFLESIIPSAVSRLGFLGRPAASDANAEKFNLYDYLTFRNIVIAVAVCAFLILLAAVFSFSVALVAAFCMGVVALGFRETSNRRRWEVRVLGELQRLSSEHNRLLQDVARSRNELDSLRLTAHLSPDGFPPTPAMRPLPPEAAMETRISSGLAAQISALSKNDAPKSTRLPADETEIARRLNDDQVLQLVDAALRKNKIDLFLQPIVNLPQRKVRFFEAFSRICIMDGAFLPASRYIDIVQKKSLTPAVDNLLLLRGLQAILQDAARDYNHAFFFNITSSTLGDAKFMTDLAEFIAQHKDLSPQLVFEMSQEDFANISEDVVPALDGLSRLGCRFSMDRVSNISFNLAYLESRHIRFIKIETTLILMVLQDPAGLARLKRLKAALDRSGIDLIVEKIETERQLLELLDVEIDYGQGYLFGRAIPRDAAA